MKDTNIKQKNKEKRSSNSKNSSQNKLKKCIPEKLISNKVCIKRLIKLENENRQIKSKFNNKLELPKDKDIYEIAKSAKDFKNFLPFNSEKKIMQNSVFKDLITKILEINHTDSSLKNNSSRGLLYPKEEFYSNSIKTIKSNKISFNNNPIIEYKIESKKNIKKNENNKIETSPQLKNKNNKQDIKNKNNINSKSGSASGSQDVRKYSNIKTDSDYKNNSSITDNFKTRKKKADIFLGLNQVSGSSSSLTFRVLSQNNIANFPVSQRSNLKNNNNENKYNMSKKQKEIAQSIMDLDLAKLQKEVYDYENTDVTDAINRLPTHKFDCENTINKNKNIIKRCKTKESKEKSIKNRIKNIKERFRILRKVGYVYDSLDDEEYEDEEDNNFYFEPNGNFILILDFIILITSLIDLIFLPIHLSSSLFNENELIRDFFFVFIDIIFIVDFVCGFFRAYYNFDEYLIKNSVLILQNYLKTWFLLDFICGIPVYSILRAYKFENFNCFKNCYFNYNGKNLYHLFEMIKLLKLLKTISDNIAREKIRHKFRKINFFYFWGHFIKQVFTFISILNLSSCLFIFAARNSYPNWILNMNLNIHNFMSIYVCSFYFTITTMTTVGYGDIEIISMTERIFEILFLIIGTCLYSWMLTFTSNYIKKRNEKNIKFEQKIEILDDIKLNYPLMTNDLYRRIYKLLYYKKSHQKIDKNIIIDSLPYSIRNNLLTQMYNPTITNFKFFRYFENSEFIIEIVSVLKPLVSMKGDLLLNEGDYIEDIILNKSGILTLDICIDLNNPYEFIKQYLIKYNLGNVKNNNIDSNIDNSSINKKNSINSNNSISSYNFNKTNNSTIKSNNMNFLKSFKHEKSTLEREKTIKKKVQYLKILNIRKKEHFGGVLMFLNEPSPLNVRVNTKISEVLLLSKTDILKISSNFPNIWRRMNESSIFNLEQIRNVIMKKLSIFCFSNGIKIKSLYNKKDTKTGQNKIKYSLIPIPDAAQLELLNQLNQNNNINESNNNNSKYSEYNSSQSFENFKKDNTFIINEVESSEESRTNNSKSTKEIKYSNDNNAISNKGAKIMNDNIKMLNQKEYASDFNINNKKINKYYTQTTQNKIENQNKSYIHSKSYGNFYQKKNSILSNKNKKSEIKKNRTKNNTNVYNINENDSSKNSIKSYLNNSPIMNTVFNSSVISYPKGFKKCQNFAEKSKINKKLISIPSFSFMQNYNNSLISGSENVNDEIYPHENFEIKIPENDQNLIIKNSNETKENSNVNCPDLQKKLLISDKKNVEINTDKEDEKRINDSNNLNSINKFNNLKISYISTFEIKSSYDNINEFTKYTFITNDTLIKKTKIFLSRECGFLCDTNSKLIAKSSYTPTPNRRKKSRSSIKLSKCLQNKKSYDSPSRMNNLFVINDNNLNSLPSFSKELKRLGYKRTKNNEKNNESSFKEIKSFTKSVNHIKRNATIKDEKELYNKRNSASKIMSSDVTPKKGKKKAEVSDSSISMKTKVKLDLITKNMKRDSRNLNNPNEFYADLFSNFYKRKLKKVESQPTIPKVKIKYIDREKDEDSSEDKEEKDKENSICDS